MPTRQRRVVSVTLNLRRETCAVYSYSYLFGTATGSRRTGLFLRLLLQALSHYSSASSHHASRVQSRTAVLLPPPPPAALPPSKTALETGSALTPGSQSTWPTLPFPGQNWLPCQSGSVSKFFARDKRLREEGMRGHYVMYSCP